MEWDNIYAAQTGSYTLEFRYANADSVDRRVKININRVTVGELALKPTGSWSTWSTASLQVTLNFGYNTVFVKAITEAGGPNLDQVKVTAVTSGGGSGGGAGLRAFPSAEGFGRLAQGGRGGDVYYVNTLNDTGAGSLRYGIESASGPRTIVFAISGNVKLKSPLRLNRSNITIAGQTAPGDGITLRDNTFVIEDANNIIVRYIRVRLGDNPNLTGDADNWDTIRVEDVSDLMMDHISASWGIDGIQDWRRVRNATLQWSLYGEALNEPDNGHDDGGAHAMLLSVRDLSGNASLHHNVFFSSRDRHPSLCGGRHGNTTAILDYRNNLNYNWDGETNLGSCRINAINNYYKPGPSTDRSGKPLATKTEIEGAAKGYLSGNYFLNMSSGFTSNNYSAVDFDKWDESDGKYFGVTLAEFRAASEFSVTKPATQAATALPELLYPKVGASLRRDAADIRVIAGIRNGTSRLIDSEDEVGGFPVLNASAAPVDSDRDGMPDAWETRVRLNPNVRDNNGKTLSSLGYTNLEVYLNSLVGE